MPIVFETGIDLPQPPSEVFAFLDDFKKVPLWHTRCEGVAKLGQGPNALGDKLRYAYHEGGKHRIMDGVITAYEPDRQLGYRYFDQMMQAFIEFRFEPSGTGTRLTHRVELVPHSFLAKLLSPMFRYKLPRQITAAMDNVKRVLGESQA